MQDTPTTHRWLRRGFLGVPLVLWVVIATAGTALAIVGFVVLLGIDGSVSTGDGIDVEYVENTGTVVDQAAIGTCTISNTATQISLSALGMISYDICYFEVDVVNNGTEAAKLQYFKLNDVQYDPTKSIDDFNPQLITTNHGSYCGAEVLPGATATVGFELMMGSELEIGVSASIDPARDGLTFVRSDIYEGANCQ